MIAYHFPPVRVSSGIQRTLKFCRYLLDYDWKAQVLTINPRAYIQVNEGQMNEIPDNVYVKRAFALDTSRHLSFKGRYLSWMALPDRWVSWCFAGTISGLVMVLKFKPKVIWSTYPIASAHLLGLIMHRLTGIPWIADFRDSMTEDDYPVNPRQRKVYRWIEEQTIKHCVKAVFTTPGAITMYAERYPQVPKNRWALIPNGFDEDNFVSAEKSDAYKLALQKKNKDKIVLLHSGVLYRSECDPSEFFKALAELLEKGIVNSKKFKIILRATGHDELHSELIKQNNLQDCVLLEPSISYEEALAEMLTVDGLLLFQASNCNHQIPAKVYEYLRAKRPIFALTDPLGDTAEVLKDANIQWIVPLDDKDAIVQELTKFLEQLELGDFFNLKDEIVNKHSRSARTKLLAQLISDVTE
jgi:glycosyltransferase involved in cell wall biosynthesis